jgi:polysaccharide biosynthesis transport protein
MTLIFFLRLLSRNIFWIFPLALIAAVMVFRSTKDEVKMYETASLVNTGLVSGYNIESSANARIDYGYVSNEMENIIGIAKSRDLQLEIGTHLLTQALMVSKPSTDVIGDIAFKKLKKEITDSLRQFIVDTSSYENTLSNVRTWRNQIEDNPIKKIIKGNHSLFGVEQIATVSIKSEGKTDMIRLKYSCSDPSICRNTLILLTNLVTEKYRSVKQGQSSDVVSFFEKATYDASSSLNGKETNMLDFMVQNKIINYYEQTRYIASKKEDLDEMYFKEMMQLAAADSARRSLDAQLAKYIELPVINQNLMKNRSELANVSSKLAGYEISGVEENATPQDDLAVKKLRDHAERIKKELRTQAEATFAILRTPEGIEVKDVLSNWLAKFIEVEQGLARLNVFKIRQSEFNRLYSRYAPWGSEIKRIERGIDVAEKAYLENLKSYNQARLHQYNTMMTGNLRVVDAPNYPETALPSKRMTLVIVAFLVGFIIPIVGLLIKELVDKSLKNPDNAHSMTGIDVLGAIPKLPKNWEKHSTIDYKATLKRVVNQIVQHVKTEIRDGQVQPFPRAHVAVVGTRGKEGKSFIINALKGGKPGFILTEFPALLSEKYSADFSLEYDYILLIAHTSYPWNEADKKAVKALSKLMKCPCKMIINGVRIEDLESSIGEIPKKRSKIRRWIKKVLLLNFSRSPGKN